jgi:hypothetical protein
MRRRSRLSLYQNHLGQTALHESGYSWVAGFMLPVWLMLHGFAGWVVLASGVMGTAATLAVQSVWPDQVAWLWLLMVLVQGGVANRFYRWQLERQGWVRVAQECTT